MNVTNVLLKTEINSNVLSQLSHGNFQIKCSFSTSTSFELNGQDQKY